MFFMVTYLTSKIIAKLKIPQSPLKSVSISFGSDPPPLRNFPTPLLPIKTMNPWERKSPDKESRLPAHQFKQSHILTPVRQDQISDAARGCISGFEIGTGDAADISSTSSSDYVSFIYISVGLSFAGFH